MSPITFRNSTPTLAPLTHPRRSLVRRATMGAVLLTVLAIAGCAWLFNSLTARALARTHEDHVRMLGQMVAAALVDDPAQALDQRASRVLDLLTYETHLAFVAVMDERGQLLHRRNADAAAWSAHERWRAAHDEQLESNQSVSVPLDRRGELVAYRVPVWDPPLNDEQAQAAGAARTLRGYVVLALREPNLPRTLGYLRAGQLTAAAGIALLVALLTPWITRRWLRPLDDLLLATQMLSHGKHPPLLPVHGQDEISRLTDAFNSMARRLFAAHHRLRYVNDELRRSNEELENKIAQRTADLRLSNDSLRGTVAQLSTLAATDPLTGLANRRAVEQALGRAFADARRRGQPLACLALDLDGFKAFNDAHGHAAGDLALTALSKALQRAARASDLPGRLGGDEFVILLPGSNATAAREVAQRIARLFAQQRARLTQHYPRAPQVTISIGLACLDSGAATPDQLLRHADHALYAAKRAGKARLAMYDGALAPQPAARAA